MCVILWIPFKIMWIFNNAQRVFSENISSTLEAAEVTKASKGELTSGQMMAAIT